MLCIALVRPEIDVIIFVVRHNITAIIAHLCTVGAKFNKNESTNNAMTNGMYNLLMLVIIPLAKIPKLNCNNQLLI